MLGAPLLQDWILEIDYPAQRLRLAQAEPCEHTSALESRFGYPPEQIFELETLPPGLPFLPHQLLLEGQRIPRAFLDTGNNASLVLCQELAEKTPASP